LQYNPDKIRKITSEILLCLRRLEELGALETSLFLADPHKMGSAKYHLVVAIEGIVDLCNHIIARNGFKTPEDYSDTIRVMEEHQAFGREFAETLIRMVRFRNRLVHIYWEIDDNEIWRILKEHLSDIRRFLREFGTYVGLILDR
jgi:uncharacterized protein YutE (UPF0331/DUF86 family)